MANHDERIGFDEPEKAKKYMEELTTMDAFIGSITQKELVTVIARCQERGIATMIGVHKDFDNTLTPQESDELAEILDILGGFISKLFDNNETAVKYIQKPNPPKGGR